MRDADRCLSFEIVPPEDRVTIEKFDETGKLPAAVLADGKGVVLKNVNYFNAVQNDGFQMYKSIEHRADLNGHQFSYSDRNAFLITIVSQEPKKQ